MKRKTGSIFSWMVGLILAVMVQNAFAADKTVEFTSVDEGGVISIYPDAFPVERTLKGRVKGFSKAEIVDLGLTVDVLVLDVPHGPEPVEKNGKWKIKVTLKDADLVLKAVIKDKTGKELAATSIKATASGEF
nr:hypothetical protein [Desulfobacula sp.]